MKRAAIVLGLTAVFLSGCSSVDRPEGVVERWLTSINQGRAGEPDLLGNAELAEQLLPGWRRCDPGAFDVIEVSPGGPGKGVSAPYLVPFHLVVASNFETLCGHPPAYDEQVGIAHVEETPLGNQVVEFSLGGVGKTIFPSEGGPEIAGADTVAWVISLAAAVALSLLVMLLMTTLGKHHTLAEEVVGEDVGHHHGGPA